MKLLCRWFGHRWRAYHFTYKDRFIVDYDNIVRIKGLVHWACRRCNQVYLEEWTYLDVVDDEEFIEGLNKDKVQPKIEVANERNT